MSAQAAQGVMFSENLPDDLDLDKLEDLDDEGEFFDFVNAPGRYIAKLVNVKTHDDGKAKPSENLMFKVVDGTPADQRGKVHIERVYYSAIERATKLGKRMGVWTDEQHAEMVKLLRNNEPANGPNYAPCIGQEFVVVLKRDTYTDSKGEAKESIKMDYVGIWRIDDPRVGDFVASIKGGGSGNGTNTNEPGGASDKATPAKTTTASKGRERTTSAGKGTAGAGAGAKTAASINEL